MVTVVMKEMTERFLDWKVFSRSEEVKGPTMADVYISTVWCRGSPVCSL